MVKVKQKKQQGFTLIELLIAIFGFTLIIWGLIALVSNVFFASKTQSGLLSDIDQARRLAFQITTELRSGQSGSNGSYVLDTAADQQIIFYGNSDIDSGIERIRYFIQNGSLYKGITEYDGASYNTTTEKTILVQSDLANGSSPVFYYYDGSYTGLASQSPLSQPVNVTQVKFIKIALQIYNKAGVKNNNIYTVNASATIRNLKTNLGQ